MILKQNNFSHIRCWNDNFDLSHHWEKHMAWSWHLSFSICFSWSVSWSGPWSGLWAKNNFWSLCWMREI